MYALALYLMSALSAVASEHDRGDGPFGIHPALVARQGYARSGFSDAVEMGVQWGREGVYAFWFLVQPDLTRDEYDFSINDRQWRDVPASINILANIAPQGPIDEGRCLPGSWLPIDELRYAAFVRATVERYDGDGVDDMPGLANPISYWQVGNEPPGPERRTGFAGLQKSTYIAIKEACADCTVLIGGATGAPIASAYIIQFDRDYKPILDALGGRYVDVFDFHWYGNAMGDYRGCREVYDHIRSVLSADGFGSIPIWITEMGSYSGAPSAVRGGEMLPQSEAQQAADYFKRFVLPLSLGIKKVFPAFGLIEGFKYDNGYFDHTGFIYDGIGAGDPGLGVRKLSFYTYRKSVELLDGVNWDSVDTIQESAGVHLYHVSSGGRPLYIAWWDYFDDPRYTPGDTVTVVVHSVRGNSAVMTELVPKFASGAEVTDYPTAFRTTPLEIDDGMMTITIGTNPVVVEVSGPKRQRPARR